MAMYSTILLPNIQEKNSTLTETDKKILSSMMFKVQKQNSPQHIFQGLPAKKPEIDSSVLRMAVTTKEVFSTAADKTFKKDSKMSNLPKSFRLNLKPLNPFQTRVSADLKPLFMADGQTIYIMDQRELQSFQDEKSGGFDTCNEESETPFNNPWKNIPLSKDSNVDTETSCSKNLLNNDWKMWEHSTTCEDFFSDPLSAEKSVFAPAYNSEFKNVFMESENVSPTFLNVNLLTPKLQKSFLKVPKFHGTDEELQKEDIFHDACDDLDHSCEESTEEENIERTSDYEDAYEHFDSNESMDDNFITEKSGIDVQLEAGDMLQMPDDEKSNVEEIQVTGDENRLTFMTQITSNRIPSIRTHTSLQSTSQFIANSAPCRSKSLVLENCFSDPSRLGAPFDFSSLPSLNMFTSNLLEQLKLDSVDYMFQCFARKNKDMYMAMGDGSSKPHSSVTPLPAVDDSVSIPTPKLPEAFSDTSIDSITNLSNTCSTKINQTTGKFQNAECAEANVTADTTTPSNVQEDEKSVLFTSQKNCEAKSNLDAEIGSENIINASTISLSFLKDSTPSCTSTEQQELNHQISALNGAQPQLIQFYDDNVQKNRNVLLYSNQALENICKEFKNEVPPSEILNMLVKSSTCFGSTTIRGIVDFKLTSTPQTNPSSSSPNKLSKLWKRFQKPYRSVLIMLDLVAASKVEEEHFINTRFLKKFRAFAKHDCRRKSGFVITKSRSNLWLTQAGLYDDGQLDPFFASSYFDQYVGRKLVINPYDYMLYLVKMAYKTGIDIHLMYDRMLACAPPPPKFHIYSARKKFKDKRKLDKSKNLLDGNIDK